MAATVGRIALFALVVGAGTGLMMWSCAERLTAVVAASRARHRRRRLAATRATHGALELMGAPAHVIGLSSVTPAGSWRR